MRVMVTGATGLLGTAVVAKLVARGAHVVVLVRDATKAQDGTQPLVHDLAVPFRPEALPSVDCVIHLAAHAHIGFPDHATALARLNTGSTQELLEAARLRKVPRFVYASSGAVYGWSDHPLDELEPLRPLDFYALTKFQAEAYVTAYGELISTCIVRPFFPYGAGQTARLISRLAESIAQGNPVALRPGDRPTINPVYVDDAADAIVAVAEGDGPPVLNVAGPNVVSIRELAIEIGHVIGREPTFEPLEDPIEGDLVGRTDRLSELLGRPLIPLREGLRAAFLR